VRLKTKYRFSIRVFFASLTFGASSAAAFAQALPVACFFAPAKMVDSDISAFLASPNGLLSEFPSAGLPMSSKVRGLTGSSTAVLDPMIALVKQANAPQKSAIGAGLARAAKSCQVTTPDYALQIQQKVAAANDQDLTTAFIAGMNDVQTASLGTSGAGASASGIAGGGTPGLSSGGTNSADVSTKTNATTFNNRSNSNFSTGTSARFVVTSVELGSTSQAN
jgi:hypothetical protein